MSQKRRAGDRRQPNRRWWLSPWTWVALLSFIVLWQAWVNHLLTQQTKAVGAQLIVQTKAAALAQDANDRCLRAVAKLEEGLQVTKQATQELSDELAEQPPNGGQTPP